MSQNGQTHFKNLAANADHVLSMALWLHFDCPMDSFNNFLSAFVFKN